MDATDKQLVKQALKALDDASVMLRSMLKASDYVQGPHEGFHAKVDIEFLATAIEDLEFGPGTSRFLSMVRQHNMDLERHGPWKYRSPCQNRRIETVRDLAFWREAHLLSEPNIGRLTVARLKAKLVTHGIHLGMFKDVAETDPYPAEVA
jgi:hypothetical protein